jgi:hypothetical protein
VWAEPTLQFWNLLCDVGLVISRSKVVAATAIQVRPVTIFSKLIASALDVTSLGMNRKALRCRDIKVLILLKYPRSDFVLPGLVSISPASVRGRAVHIMGLSG